MDAVDVAVIIPTFNRPVLLRDTLESVLAQTRPPREIIVVDNGPGAQTGPVLEQYGSRVTYVRVDTVGQQAARNAGIAAASSTWVATLDDDDLYDPDFLKEVSVVIDDGRADLIYTDHRRFVHPFESGRFYETSNHQRAPQGYWDGVPRPAPGAHWSYVGQFPADRLLQFTVFYPSTMVARKDLLELVGGYDPGVYGIKAEDLEFTSRVLPVAHLAIVWKELVHYRIHQFNTSGDPISQRFGRWRIFERIREKDAHGSPALAAALDVDLPRRRRVIFDSAFAHGRYDVMTEAAVLLEDRDWTLKRRAKRRVATLPRVMRDPLVRLVRPLQAGLRHDRDKVDRWSLGSRL